MRTIYKLKHKPTGLYYVKSGYSHISETGTVYSTGNNVLNCKNRIYLTTNNQELIKKHLDVFKSVGELKIQENYRRYNYHKNEYEIVTWYSWSMMSPDSDFEKEIITVDEPVDLAETVKELREIDDVLEKLDGISDDTTKDYVLGPVRRAKKLIMELRDIKKQRVHQENKAV